MTAPASASIVNVFDCAEGDIGFHIEVDLAAYQKANVSVSVSEMMDQSLATSFALDLVTLSPSAHYKAVHPRHGIVELKGLPDEGADLYVDGEKITCEYNIKGLGPDPLGKNPPVVDRPKVEPAGPPSLGDNLPAQSFGGIFYDKPSARQGGIRDTRAGENVIIASDTNIRDRGYHWFKVVIDGKGGYMWGGDLCYKDRYIDYMGERCVGFVPKPRNTVKETYGIKDPKADWIAIAVDGKGAYGFGRSVDRFDAAANAKRKCGDKCTVLERTTKLCLSYAEANGEPYGYGYGAWDHKSGAAGVAGSKCRSETNWGNCKIVETYCQ